MTDAATDAVTDARPPDATPPETRPDRPPPRRRLVPALLLLLVLAVAAAGAVAWQVRAAEAVQDARRDALEVARTSASRLLSYDSATVREDVAAGERLATGEFLREYRAATDGLVEQAERGEVVVTADVRAASVQSASAERVVALLFVDQRTTRKDAAEPRTDQNRVRLVLERVDGRWLVSGLDAL